MSDELLIDHVDQTVLIQVALERGHGNHRVPHAGDRDQ
jgi:hypothetical protein